MQQRFKDGMPVRELKKAIENWPETDWHGDETTVFVGWKDRLIEIATRVNKINGDNLLIEVKGSDSTNR